MKRFLVLCFLFLSALGLSLKASPSFSAEKSNLICDTTANLFLGFIKSGFAPAFIMISKTGVVYEFFINQKGDFFIIGIESDKRACIIDSGIEFSHILAGEDA